MKKIWTPFLFACVASVGIYSCKKEAKQSDTPTASVSTETMAKIHQLGFSTTGVEKVDDGYLVEGDIVLSDELLNSTPDYKFLRIGGEEQYRTTNLVTGMPRVITITVVNLGTAYVQGADLAISRYNALGSQITFKRVTTKSADITIKGFNQPPSGGYITLGSSGFPTSTGNPYSTIKMNTNQYAYGSNPDVNYVGSVIQHEMGHCIGFRHTDYMDRSYSCGGAYSNEGASNVGAINIPGTPTGPDPNSWMLACSNGGDRTFNSNDVTAIHYLYH